MKKLIFLFVAAFAVVFCVSCDKSGTSDSNNTGLVYNVTADASGQVEFSWFQGNASINGEAKVVQCNDSTKLLLNDAALKNSTTLAEALESNDKKVAESAKAVSDMIIVNGVDGEYHLSIKGYVKYGPMVFYIDEEYPKQ